jgi:hypothetical protein
MTFRQMVDSHDESLLNYGQFLLGSAAEAEDVVYRAFLLAFDRLYQYHACEGGWYGGFVGQSATCSPASGDRSETCLKTLRG